MGITHKVLRISGTLFLLLLALLIGVSAWNVIEHGTPKLMNLIDMVVSRYDNMFPEITIQNGIASIKESQPFYINTGDPNLVVVIDTRENEENKYMDHLQKQPTGLVLTRNQIVIKNDDRIQTVPLKDIPDFVVNSKNLKTLVSSLEPTVMMIIKAIILV